MATAPNLLSPSGELELERFQVYPELLPEETKAREEGKVEI